MNSIIQHTVVCGLFLVVAPLGSPLLAQTDRIYPIKGTLTSGTIIDTNPNGVTIQAGGAERKFANQLIKKIVFNGEPSPLADTRDLLEQDQLEAAYNKITTVNIKEIQRDVIKADAMFYLAYCQSQMALAGQGDKNSAIRNLLSFVSDAEGKKSFHFYTAVRALGDLALAVGSYDNAVKYYGALAGAADPDLKFEAKYLVGWSNLKQNKLDQAKQDFDAIGSANASSAEQKRIKYLAAAGLAVVAAGKGNPDEGLASLNTLVKDCDTSDAELFGRLFNAQGACYAAKSDTMGAVLSYLKTHMLYPSNTDADAQALTELVQLWPQLGQPERANEARSLLQQRYPGYK